MKRRGRLIAIGVAAVIVGALAMVPYVASAQALDYYYIVNDRTDQCLVPRNDPSSDNVLTGACEQVNLWTFNGRKVVDFTPALCLTHNTIPVGINIRMSVCRAQREPRQEWSLSAFDGTPTTIISAVDGCALGDSSFVGDAVNCAAPIGSPNQKWRIVYSGSQELPDGSTA